ncbi:hypothetical protein EPA93_44710 [Ktedonosporobacter rubrisoli]|uniref:Uncharacterized protein n=1 Tax=Ktedonosporobacter rubrisoli TaxID=2509675 RepID=A0A4P6K585_KTERU|nr:hypothetical protein [Ktedonosporobacter rubrisoli]QBD82696.1 hypothetical protein EPA93_44710 [Ktedonosporobacter rubrisoli]
MDGQKFQQVPVVELMHTKPTIDGGREYKFEVAVGDGVQPIVLVLRVSPDHVEARADFHKVGKPVG